MKRLHITFTVGVLLCANLYAAESKDVVVREVIGKGSSRSQAIKDALYVAVSQVRGVEVGSGTYELGFSEAGIGVDSGQADKRRVEFDSLSVATSGTVYTTKIGGAVKSYEVIDEKELADSGYEVKLKVTVYDYAPRGDSQRPKIGVMPVRTLADSYSFLDVQTPSSVLSSLLSQRLAVGLTQTNKFAVLDRESIAEFALEKRLLVSNDAPLEERAKLAEMLGSDYLLTGAISQAKLEKKQKVLGAANYTVNEYKARVVFNYRLIVSFTRQVVVAGVVEKYLENEQIRALADEQSSAEWDGGQIRDAILAIVANEAVAEIIDRLYPMRVASVQENGVVVVNQGGDRISQGMLLDVFTEGEEVFDPDTKESLGKVQNVIATIRVKGVAEKMSFAEVIDGDLSKISKGLICRARKPKKEDDSGMKRNVIRNESGGVKLPFDK
jgi:hypothetical protein